jgi:hypothetical protein
MPIEVRQTIVTPGREGRDAIQIHISDAPPDDESATFVVRILATVDPLKTPTMAHIQRQVMSMAQDALTPLLRDLAKEIQDAGYGLALPPKHPRR